MFLLQSDYKNVLCGKIYCKVRTRQSWIWCSQNRNILVNLGFHCKFGSQNCNKLHTGRPLYPCIAPLGSVRCRCRGLPPWSSQRAEPWYSTQIQPENLSRFTSIPGAEPGIDKAWGSHGFASKPSEAWCYILNSCIFFWILKSGSKIHRDSECMRILHKLQEWLIFTTFQLLLFY